MTGDGFFSGERTITKSCYNHNIWIFTTRQWLEKTSGQDKAHGLNKTQLNKKCENSDLLYKNFDFNKFSITNEEINDLSCDIKHEHLQKLL